MNKRDFLRMAPLAALGVVPLMIGDVSAKAYEVSAAKRYIVVLPDDANLEGVDLGRLQKSLGDRGVNATVMANCDGLQIYEV